MRTRESGFVGAEAEKVEVVSQNVLHTYIYKYRKAFTFVSHPHLTYKSISSFILPLQYVGGLTENSSCNTKGPVLPTAKTIVKLD